MNQNDCYFSYFLIFNNFINLMIIYLEQLHLNLFINYYFSKIKIQN